MWKVILAVVPWEVVIPWLVQRLTDLSDMAAKALVERAFDLVVEIEKKYGTGRGQEKFVAVKEELLKGFQGVSGWVINFVIELAVAYAKKKGVIR